LQEETLPRGERAHRDRCALDVIDRLRLGREDVRGNRGVLRGDAVAVERRQREDLIAGNQFFDTRADGLDHARKLIRWDRGQSINGPVQLAARDRGRPDPDQRLTRSGDGPVDLLDHDARRPAMVEESHRSHCSEPTSPAYVSLAGASATCRPHAGQEAPDRPAGSRARNTPPQPIQMRWVSIKRRRTGTLPPLSRGATVARFHIGPISIRIEFPFFPVIWLYNQVGWMGAL
jgi:hypothetical protein